MASSLVGPKPGTVQNIKYSGSDAEFCTDVTGETVIISSNDGSHTHGSSKLKLIDRIDYNWEFRYYHGHLVAAHINGKVIAYAMKGKEGGMVRVTNQETGIRALIKNFKDDIKDIAFAYIREEIILGCVDSEGNILVYKITDETNSISSTLLLHVYHHHRSSISKSNYRLIWCPYVPPIDDDEDVDTVVDPDKMFVVLNGTRASIYNLSMLSEKCLVSNIIDPDESFEGYIEINHNAEVLDASFASDGTHIAIATGDGYVKFIQLYFYNSEKQKSLFEFRPHDGTPLSSLMFIDKILEPSSECWKFLITGANDNSVIKLHSCETWSCLQTIHFKPHPNSISGLYLNVSTDYTGQYLLVSDINYRVLYVLELNRNDKEQRVQVTRMAGFLLPAPFLSFHILEATSRIMPFSYNNSTEDEFYEDRDEFDEDSERTAICLKMLVIQPKKFQECNIVFEPETMSYNSLNNSAEVMEKTEKFPKLDDLQESVSLLIQQKSSSNLTLMTPDDFTPSGRNTRPNSVRNDTSNSLEASIAEINDVVVDNLIDFQRPQKDNFASGGSSPSREVQEILSLNNSTYSTQDFFDNLPKLQDNQEEPQKDYSNHTSLNYPDKITNESVVKCWQNVPVVQENEIIKDEALRKELRLSAGDEKSQFQLLGYRINALENIVREQNVLIEKIHGDKKEVDLALSNQQLQIMKMLETLVTMQKTTERDLQENILTGVSQIFTKSLADKVQQILASEVKMVILPAIQSQVESYRHQLESQYAQKISHTDMMLRDNIAKAFNNKALADTLSLSVVNIVAPSLEKCYRDIISSSLIPSWERVCGQMFQQINETFTRGTKEYTASVESYMDKQRRVQEKGKDLIVQMQNVSETMKTNADKLTSNLTTEIHKQFQTVFKSMNDKLTSNIREIVMEQVKQGFKSHATVIEDSVMNAVRSRAVTPSPLLDSHIFSGDAL
ncbi:enhancer of mRNA-decapping protein 4 isoform X2 [Diabrotica virgifera virgifera]|uniref:Enhancer of mRNA-decapping protein 4 WD40 repeat region domain-containing protein n=2 Tax=Diabrotica virgifera virgifera TaxID=50390 RepID=A0ABM5KJY8_DIAVI|nr:enhancer of mRNA-decapping protein 4 isoform X2 [Diabrotica virgifera virgifera]